MKRTLLLLLSSLFLTACATTSQTTSNFSWPTDDPPEVSDAILAWSQGKLVLPQDKAASSHPKRAILEAESLALQNRFPESIERYIEFLKTTTDHPLVTAALFELIDSFQATRSLPPADDLLSLRMTNPFDKALLCEVQDIAIDARKYTLKPAIPHPTALPLTHIGWIGPFTSNVFSEFDRVFPPDNDPILADQYDYEGRLLEKYRYVPTHRTVFQAQRDGIYIGETYVEVDRDMDVLLTVNSPNLYAIQVDRNEVTPAYTREFQWNPLSVVRLRLSKGHHTVRVRLAKLPKKTNSFPFKVWLVPENDAQNSEIKGEMLLSSLHEVTTPSDNAPSKKLAEIQSPHTLMDMDAAANDALYSWAYNVMAIHTHDMVHADQMIKKRQAKAPNDVQNILMNASRMLGDNDIAPLQRIDSAIVSRESVSEAAPDYALVHLQIAETFLQKNMTQTAFDIVQQHRDVLQDNADTSIWMSQLYSALNWDADARDAIVHAYQLEPGWCWTTAKYLKTQATRHALPAREELAPEVQNCIDVIQAYDELGYGDITKLSNIEQISPNVDSRKLPRLLSQVMTDPDRTFDELLPILDNMSRRMQPAISASKLFPFIDAYRAMGRDELAHVIVERLLSIQPEEVNIHYLKWFIDYEKPLSDRRRDGIAIIKDYVAKAPVSDASSIIVYDYASNYYFDNGSSMLLTHTITRVVDKDGKTESGEIVLPTDAAILNLRTIKQNTYEVIEPEIIAHKSSISAPNLGVGDFIEVEYLTWKKPQDSVDPSSVLDPRFYFGMLMTPLVHSEYSIEYPSSWDMHYIFRGVEGETTLTPSCTTKNDRTRCTSSIENVSPYIAEANSVQLDDVIPNIQYYSNYSWDTIRLKLSNVLESKIAVTPYVRAYLDKLEVPEGSIRERALYIYEHVMKDIKEDDDDNYLASSATYTVMRGSGSRMPLLKALFDAADIPSEIALIRHIAAIRDLSIPTENYGDYFLPALVVETETGPAYIQTFEDIIPFDYLPPEVQGLDMISLNVDQPITQTRRDAFDDLAVSVNVQYDVLPDGDARATSTEVTQSNRGLRMRYILSQTEGDDEMIHRIIENSLARSYGRIRLNEFKYEDLKSFTKPLTIKYQFDIGNMATVNEDTMLVHASFLAYQLTSRYAALGQRRTPLVISDPTTAKRDLTFQLPEGYVFEKPETEHLVLNEPFGRFERHYTWEGRTLRIHEVIDIRPIIIQPEDYDAFRKFCVKVDGIQNTNFAAKRTDS